MPKSISQMTIHVVFATKYRQPFILPQIERELHAHISSICSELQCSSVVIGGYYDHIHILCSLSRKIAVMKLVEKIKSNSSRWMKTKADYLKDFEWQLGYAVFSVGKSEIPRLRKYIQNQHAHHANFEFSGKNKNFIQAHINEPLRAASSFPPLQVGE